MFEKTTTTENVLYFYVAIKLNDTNLYRYIIIVQTTTI